MSPSIAEGHPGQATLAEGSVNKMKNLAGAPRLCSKLTNGNKVHDPRMSSIPAEHHNNEDSSIEGPVKNNNGLVEDSDTVEEETTALPMLDPRLHRALPALLPEVLAQNSDKVAIISGSQQLTYSEVHILANNISHALIGQGVRKRDLVGARIERSIYLIPVLLGILASGAAWCPIEPSLPQQRVEQMLSSAGMKMVISDTIGALEGGVDTAVLMLDDLISVPVPLKNDQETGEQGVTLSTDDLAYVMYTSGSTGTPKGVEITHGALTNLLLSIQFSPGYTSSDRILAITSISFDVAVIDWFLPLFSGATVIIAQRHEIVDMDVLVGIMERENITIMQGTPALWGMLLDSGWNGERHKLQKILTAGEALSRGLADRLLGCCDELWNLYGVTEACVYSTLWKVETEGDIVIGGPIDNTQLYVLNENMEPVPPGKTGELCIGGLGVGRGYRNNGILTASRFPDNPFQHGKLYRTGDVARFTTGGKVSLLGRMDSQVKVRGYRVELGDIEAAIATHDEVSAAVVVGRDDRLMAYTVRKKPEPVSNSNIDHRPPIDRLLRPWLASRLPAYMLPAFFVEMDAFPVSINGKVDRKALPDPIETLPAQKELQNVPLADEMESRILLIWSRVLGHDSIRSTDSFFEIGGTSLRVVQVQKELEKLLGRTVAAAKLFEHFTIRNLAAYLSGETAGRSHEPDSTQDTTERANRHDSSKDSSQDDIAIISMACRLPGGVETPEDFWSLLESGEDAITDVPPGRWDPELLSNRSFCSRGGFLIQPVTSYDITHFNLSPREAARLDPTQYLLLETCAEAFGRAGYTRSHLDSSQTGMYVGISQIPAHASLNAFSIQHTDDLGGYTTTGSSPSTLSGRLSYTFNLTGPNMTVDTACSSSLVATHLAVSALRQGECDLAISAGIHLMLNPGLHIEFDRLGGMSPDGRCRSFSADTEGTGWAEGSVVVLLKRLSDARRDGDEIHAVIRGTAINHDGRSASLTAPSGPAQGRLIRSALKAARLQPEDIDYVEAHGTGTKLGDPIEATALGEVFGPSREGRKKLLIGAAKSNVGHTQAASGLVGLMKVVLAMKHEMLPKTVHVSKPTQAVDWEGSNMKLVESNRPWLTRSNRVRRAGVSVFGIGGTNAHVVVEEPPAPKAVLERETSGAKTPRILPFLLSADSDAALRAQVEKLGAHLSRPYNEDSMTDVAYSLATTRTHYRKRLVVTAQDKPHLLQQLASYTHLELPPSPTSAPKVAFLFAGQGTQHQGMGKDLSDLYSVFHNTIQQICCIFNTHLSFPPGGSTSLQDILWPLPGTDPSLLNHTEFAQSALFALEVALFRLWQSWGVTPDYVMGHSLGELAAAHIAGIFDLEDACRLVATRGRLMQAQAGDLGMVSMEASAEDVAMAMELLRCGGKLDVAAYNTPMQTVVSGNADALASLTSHFAIKGRKTKKLVVGHAFHSRYIDVMLDEFRAVAETVRFHKPKLNIVSSVTGHLAETGQMDNAEYWVQQVRRPVKFSKGIERLAEKGVDIFVELGPDRVLCGMGAACLADMEESERISWLSSLSSSKAVDGMIERSLGELHVRHVPIDWQAYFEPLGCRRVQLPTYAFQREFDARRKPKTETNGTVQLNGTAANGQTNGAKKASGHTPQGSQFEVAWHPAKMPNIQTSGIWGLLQPHAPSEWSTNITTALADAGMALSHVKHLKHAMQLDSFVRVWDVDDKNLQSQTGILMAEALAQLQMAAQVQSMPPLIWVTRHAVGTGQADDCDMKLGPGSLLWGLMRTARSEYPELKLRLVDLHDQSTGADVVSALLLSDEPECAVRRGQVLVPRLQRLDSIPKARLAVHSLVRLDGAVLITGGLGDLGARVARWLVDNYCVKDLVLTSRRGLATPGAEELISELSQSGCKVTVMACDIANPEAVTSIMATFTNDRALRGIIHAAGVVDSGVLSSLTPQRCETTISPKVYGALNLHQATLDMDLDLFMMFSSISGVMGMPGLANYAAANTYLDALAHMRRAQGLPATSIAYGTWAGDGGMASKLGPATVSHLAQYGLDPLPPDEGLDMLQQAVVSKRPLTMAAALELNRLRDYLENQGGGIPPLLRVLLPRQNGTAATEAAPVHRHLRDMLKEAKPDRQRNVVLTMVREVVAKALGYTNPQDVDIDRPLKDIGIDSLTAIQMRNHLATLTGLALSVSIVFRYPNLRALSEALLRNVQKTDMSAPKKVAANGTGHHLNVAAICKGVLDSSFRFDKRIPARSPNSVFLTGATGFVGAFLLHELLQQGITTYCLVRSPSIKDAPQRLLDTLQDYSLWEPKFESLVKPVIGDISRPLLGMTEHAFDHLAHEVDAVCHSGGLVDWFRPLDDYTGPNIVSAHEILRLASRGRPKAIHLISTISTLPFHNGLGLEEGDHEYGYGTSKNTAERLVSAARWRGARASIYRLPYVTASTATGHFRRDRGDFLHNFLTGCLEMGSFPEVHADMSAVLPVDYLAETIVAIMTGSDDLQQQQGQDFDYLNTHAPSCTNFFHLLGGLSDGRQADIMPFNEWKERALRYAGAHSSSPLARIAAILDGYTDETASGLFKGLPVGQNVLGGVDNFPAPSLDQGFVKAYLDRIRNHQSSL